MTPEQLLDEFFATTSFDYDMAWAKVIELTDQEPDD